jgi:hypothetical protein
MEFKSKEKSLSITRSVFKCHCEEVVGPTKQPQKIGLLRYARNDSGKKYSYI